MVGSRVGSVGDALCSDQCRHSHIEAPPLSTESDISYPAIALKLLSALPGVGYSFTTIVSLLALLIWIWDSTSFRTVTNLFQVNFWTPARSTNDV